MWQLNGKGLKYKGSYIRDEKGERVMILVAMKGGELHTVTAESHEMLKKAGWKKVK